MRDFFCCKSQKNPLDIKLFYFTLCLYFRSISMKKAVLYSSILLSLFANINAEDPKQQTTAISSTETEITKISEAFGHLIGKNLEAIGFNFDIQAVVQGLKDARNGKSAPMTEVECIQAISAIQESVFKEQAKTNLTQAEDFLKRNKKAKSIVSIEKGKVQYKIEKQGSGLTLKENLTPVIRYVGKFLDGSVFGQSREDEPISLEELIPGLQQGMLGMKEGEKRTIYIHPDLAYGTKGTLPPNSLLTFEIELLEANSSPSEEKTAHTPEAITENQIAFPVQPLEEMR